LEKKKNGTTEKGGPRGRKTDTKVKKKKKNNLDCWTRTEKRDRKNGNVGEKFEVSQYPDISGYKTSVLRALFRGGGGMRELKKSGPEGQGKNSP